MGDYKSKFNIVDRRNFNPDAEEDLMELGFFLKNKKWKNGCPFHLEFPYSDIPAMCMAKYTEHSLS
jgi:hypothetical protein